METSLQIAIGIFTAIGVFVGPIIAFVIRDKRRKRNERLKIHFDDIKLEIIEQIIGWTCGVVNRNGELVHGDRPPILPEYGFEKRASFTYFCLHFPELATEWKQLKERALNHNDRFKKLMGGSNQAGLLDNAVRIEADFEEFSSRLANLFDNISKYEMGNKGGFTRISGCPICKKF